MSSKNCLVLAIDVGTTNLKVCVYDGQRCELVYGNEEPVAVLTSADDQIVEMDPEELWGRLVDAIRAAIDATRNKGLVVSMGLSCQRNTFISWNRKTLVPCHRLIVWKDNRASNFCSEWNGSFTKKLINMCGAVAYFFTRGQRFKAARMFRLVGAMVPPRFLVTAENNVDMSRLLEANQLAIGCLDTWLLLNLAGVSNSGDPSFITEPSSASSTGMFDPFTGDWGHLVLSILGFPLSVLPSLVETTKINLQTQESLFGRQIGISASLGDSQSAVFGAGCLRKGDVKISMGTGTLFDYVSGDTVHSSMQGMYPLVGWKIEGHSTHLLEGRANDTASALRWARDVGLLPVDVDLIVEEMENKLDGDDDALCFFPSFGGIQTPLSDDFACAALMGIRTSTTQQHIARAILESVAFSVYQIWECLLQEVPNARNTTCRIRCCGGVSKNTFLCQRIATLCGHRVERVREPEFCSARGAALLAGLSAGLWTTDRVESLVDIESVFDPQPLGRRKVILQRYWRWRDAQTRCLHFHKR